MDDLDLAIRKNRAENVTVSLTHRGVPVAHQEMELRQISHQFLFGCNWGESTLALANGELSGREKELAELRNERFLQLFNQATLPFYWARFEPQQGQPQTRRLLNLAHWYADHHCVVKGHPLCWHTLAPDWLLPMSNAEILKAQLDRVQREVADFAGLVDQWDGVNEAVIMPIFDRYPNGLTRICQDLGRIELIRAVFDAARTINPRATLLLNDFDVSPAYDILVEGCLAAGIHIDVIGIQSHMHQGYWGVERTRAVLEHFERFHLPIHFTENSILSGQLMPQEIVDLNDYQVSEWPSTPEGEQRQAQEVVLHYKTLLAHPAVQAITWWDLSDGGWLNAPAGLLRRDHSPKPAYQALLKLIKSDWWLSPARVTTDASGKIFFTGFRGGYELAVGTHKYPFSVQEKGKASIAISI